MAGAGVGRIISGISLAGGFAAFYLAVGNAFLAMSVNTCTGGVADSPTGIVWSVLLFGLGLLLLKGYRFGVVGYLCLTPLTVTAILEADFALRLFVGTQIYGLSICSVMFRENYGLPEFDQQWVTYVWALTYALVCGWLLWHWVYGFYRLGAFFNKTGMG